MIIKTRHRKLTVLQVATISKPIKSDLGYCPIETVIHNIDTGLHSLGHRSIVACTADSEVTGEHYATVARSLGDYCHKTTTTQQDIITLHLSRALERAQMGDIDVIHMHEWSNYIRDGVVTSPLPIVMTLHVPATESGIDGTVQRRSGTTTMPPMYFVPISEYQRRQYRGLVNTSKAVHHGIDVNDFPSKQTPDTGSYLFTIGRVTRDKGQDTAIELAARSGSKLIIAGCVQNKQADRQFFEGLKSSIDLSVEVGKYPVGRDYYDRVIKPLLECDKQIIYIGELGSEQNAGDLVPHTMGGALRPRLDRIDGLRHTDTGLQ
jgi:glycosyltransferase involved in cell wall biosynthesis